MSTKCDALGNGLLSRHLANVMKPVTRFLQKSPVWLQSYGLAQGSQDYLITGIVVSSPLRRLN